MHQWSLLRSPLLSIHGQTSVTVSSKPVIDELIPWACLDFTRIIRGAVLEFMNIMFPLSISTGVLPLLLLTMFSWFLSHRLLQSCGLGILEVYTFVLNVCQEKKQCRLRHWRESQRGVLEAAVPPLPQPYFPNGGLPHYCLHVEESDTTEDNTSRKSPLVHCNNFMKRV